MKNHSPKEPKIIKEDIELEEEIIEEDLEKDLNESLESLNYNDRPDGYGFGEAESQDSKRAYEKDPKFTEHCIDLGEGYRHHKNEPYTKDDYGLRNQYGPVDQYVFRDAHLFYRGRHKEKKEEKEKK